MYIGAFVSYCRAYQNHQCSYIFRFSDLDLGRLATAFGLIELPRKYFFSLFPLSPLVAPGCVCQFLLSVVLVSRCKVFSLVSPHPAPNQRSFCDNQVLLPVLLTRWPLFVFTHLTAHLTAFAALLPY